MKQKTHLQTKKKILYFYFPNILWKFQRASLQSTFQILGAI